MADFRVIEVKRSIFEDNDADANKLREELKAEKTFLLNLMSSSLDKKSFFMKNLHLSSFKISAFSGGL